MTPDEKQKARSLIELAQLSQSIENQLMESDGLITPEIELAIMELEKNLTTKADAYGFVLRKLESESTFYKLRAEQLSQMSDHLKNVATKMKDRAKAAMLSMGVSKIEGDEVTLSLAKGRGAVCVSDITALPRDCIIETVQIKADKEKIGALLREGIPVSGASLDETWTIRIKP